MPLDRPEIRLEEKNVRYNSGGSVYPLVALLVAIIAFSIVGGVVFLLWTIRQHLAIVAWTWLLSIAALPVVGIGYLVVELWHRIRRVQVIDIGEKGTILRSSTGNLQILGTDELYALETRNAVRNTIDALPVPQEPIPEQLGYPFPQSFPASPMIESISSMETPMETDAETVLETLRGEQASAEAMLHKKQLEVAKNRIQVLHGMGLSLSSIAKAVKMEGRKYNEFKVLCEELGIHSD